MTNKDKKNKTLIITATKDRPLLLQQAMRSVLDQTAKDFIYVIVNSGESEPTRAIVNSIARGDQRIIYTECDVKSSAAAARNEGLKYIDSTVSFVKFLDDDDLFESRNSLEVLVRTAQKSKTGFVYARQRRIDIEGKELSLTASGPLNIASVIENASFPFASTLFTADLIIRLGGFLPMKSSEDLELICRAFLLSADLGLKARYVDKIISCYRKHTGSLNFKNKLNGEKDKATLLLRARFSKFPKGLYE